MPNRVVVDDDMMEEEEEGEKSCGMRSAQLIVSVAVLGSTVRKILIMIHLILWYS